MARILVIDDHAVVRQGLRTLLGDAGHEVVGEADGVTAALAAVSRLQPEVILLDLSLGDRSGLEVLAELQRRDLPGHVLVLSMSAQPRNVADALRLGARGYVLKGSSNARLLRAVSTVASGGVYLGEEEAGLAEKGRSDPKAQSLSDLSPRERQILVMVARGDSSSVIAERLHLSPKTVDTYRSRLMAKLGLRDIPAVVRWAVRHGLVSLDD